jgi:hypothetical protein
MVVEAGRPWKRTHAVRMADVDGFIRNESVLPVVLVPSSNKFARYSKRNML